MKPHDIWLLADAPIGTPVERSGSMPTVVVWDCETDSSFRSLAGMSRDQQLSMMQVTVVCALVFDSDDCLVPENWEVAHAAATECVFWRDGVTSDGRGPFAELLDIFDAAEVIVAYNGLSFDLPVLKKHYGYHKNVRYMEHRMKMLDPMVRIAAATDLPFFKLSRLLEANHLPSKTGDGLEAIKLWEQGKRSKLHEYCKNDVAALAQLVHLTTLKVPCVGTLPNTVHGVASALKAARAVRPTVALDPEAFEIV